MVNRQLDMKGLNYKEKKEILEQKIDESSDRLEMIDKQYRMEGISKTLKQQIN